MKKIAVLGLALLVGSMAQATNVDFEAFNIRNHNPGGTIVPPWDTDMGITENATGNGFRAWTPRGGQKVGYGTGAFNGWQANELTSVTWDYVDGPGSAPYLNLWVSDGTNYAVLAVGASGYNTNPALGSTQSLLVYENDPSVDLDWLFDVGQDGSAAGRNLQVDGSGATLSDLADDIFLFAGVPMGPLNPGVGTGPPQGGYGLNIIYGDTQSNYTNHYEITNLAVTFDRGNGTEVYTAAPVPEPATVSLLLMGVGGLVVRQRRKRA